MTEQFLHGVQLVSDTVGTRPVKTVKSSVIGCVLKASKEIPATLVTTEKDIAYLKGEGAEVDALHWIRQQGAAMIVAVGTVDATTAVAADKGLELLKTAESTVFAEPRIIICPEFSSTAAVATKMKAVADSLQAVAIIDCPKGADKAAAKAYAAANQGSRTFTCWPYVKASDKDGAEVEAPMAPFVAGLIAKSDNERGFWWSPSNQEINGIVGLKTAVDFKLGVTDCTANEMNELKITTIVNQSGYKLWGNRMGDNSFISVLRTKDLINDSLQRAHLWAVDQNLTSNFIESVTGSVNAYLRHLTALGAILGGECWVDPELNTPEILQQGKVYFDFDFTPPTPAEHITFRSHLVNTYFANIVGGNE